MVSDLFSYYGLMETTHQSQFINGIYSGEYGIYELFLRGHLGTVTHEKVPFGCLSLISKLPGLPKVLFLAKW